MLCLCLGNETFEKGPEKAWESSGGHANPVSPFAGQLDVVWIVRHVINEDFLHASLEGLSTNSRKKKK